MSKLEELGFELRHVGINCENEGEACSVAERFETIFGFTKKVGNSRGRGYENTVSWKERTHCHRHYRRSRSSEVSGEPGRGV